MDPEKLLLQISNGKTLSPEEVEELIHLLEGAAVGDELRRDISLDDVYSYLVVLGRAKCTRARHVLERYLEMRDPLTVALVLEVLCLEWGFTEEFLERVVNFAVGVAWDYDEDVKQTALKILGEYLLTSLRSRKENDGAMLPREQRVIDLLFTTFDDQAGKIWCRQAAYFALCRAGGLSWEELPGECTSLDFSSRKGEVRYDVLDRLRALAGGE